MTNSIIRQQLHKFIDNADDKKVKGLFMFIEDEISTMESFPLTQEQWKLIEEEREMHANGISRSYSWEEAQQLIRNKK